MITPTLLREWSACWPDATIAARFGKRTEVTPREIAADDSISLNDRMWVLCRSLWYLDESAARGFAIESAMLVSHLAGDEDDQARHAEMCAHLLEIEDLPADQRAAAWSAARDAARSAARDAAWSAARDAARSAARDAARSAARDAAWSAARDAAWSAAWAAAWDAAMSEALARALEWLGEYADGWEE